MKTFGARLDCFYEAKLSIPPIVASNTTSKPSQNSNFVELYL